MDWIQFGLLLISIGGMFMWLRSDIALNRTESAADRRDILQIIREIQQENKDFHGRLAVQDAEFKSHMMHIHGVEERNKGK